MHPWKETAASPCVLNLHDCARQALPGFAISSREQGAVMPSEQAADGRAARIHPTAVVSAEAVLGDGVVVGPHVVIEGLVDIGPDCVLRPHATLCGPLKMGRNNVVYSGAVLGDRPQHLKYNCEPTSVEIGDHNIFREHVTIHRGTTQSWT